MARTHRRRRSATATTVALLSAALLIGQVGAADNKGPAAVLGSSFERPHLLDGMLPPMAEAARQWVLGDRAYVGLLAGKDVETKLCDPGVQSQSGYFKVTGTKDTNYFYWFFESRSDPANDPVIVWLTGGPGCSSILALLSENGPCFVNADGTDTTINPYSWTNKANVIWIDQPAGVGFSYKSKDDPVVDTEDEVGEDLYQFLQSFFAANPRFAANPFYIFGESYGGHYVPAISHRIFTGNEKLAKAAAAEGKQEQQQVHINLKGLGIGNGLTDPEIQYQYYAAYGMNNTYGIQLFSEDTAYRMDRAVPRCVSLIHSCQNAGAAACVLSRVFCSARILEYFPLKERNIYDIRKNCTHPPLCYDFDNVGAWLARPDVREALHVHPEAGEWNICSDRVMMEFMPDVMRNYHQLLVPLLESGIKVLAYGGNADFICNVFGIEAWTDELVWQGQEGYRATEGRIWQTADGKPAGVIRSHGGLTFLNVDQSGHMVPLDQPEAALEMLNAFTGVDPQAVQFWEAAIRDGKPATKADAADATAAATPLNENKGSSNNKGARALRGNKGVVEQEIEAVPTAGRV